MPVATFNDLKDSQREARRALIRASAQTLFARQDFASVTARDIAKAAGVSPGTIYRYYENMDDLFLDVFFVGAKEIACLVEAECKKPGGCRVRRLCEIYIGFLNDNITYYQMMSHFMIGGRLSDTATERLNPVMRRIIDLIQEVLKNAEVGGNTRMTSHALFSALNGIMISYAKYPGRSLEEIRAHTVRLAGVVAGFFEQGENGRE
ncbi:MAG: TetR/AcrR family transcriptional regulator [Deltaproteobacteria bacterium]|nr:TetR/AcrR family transcriptional regulator [Candidatus Zymogenaceae bacterium]